MLPGDFTVSEGHGHPLVYSDWMLLPVTNKGKQEVGLVHTSLGLCVNLSFTWPGSNPLTSSLIHLLVLLYQYFFFQLCDVILSGDYP